MKIFVFYAFMDKNKACKLEQNRIIDIITTATKDKLCIRDFKITCQVYNLIIKMAPGSKNGYMHTAKKLKDTSKKFIY